MSASSSADATTSLAVVEVAKLPIPKGCDLQERVEAILVSDSEHVVLSHTSDRGRMVWHRLTNELVVLPPVLGNQEVLN